MLPDVQDPAVRAAAKLGCVFLESYFYRAALEAGWRDQPGRRDAEAEARQLMDVWKAYGYSNLPKWVKEFTDRCLKKKPKVFSEVPIKVKVV